LRGGGGGGGKVCEKENFRRKIGSKKPNEKTEHKKVPVRYLILMKMGKIKGEKQLHFFGSFAAKLD
jgi:hypothetical protein